MKQSRNRQSTGKLLYRITEAMDVLSMSRSVIYQEMRAGRLRSVKRGRSRFISASAVADYVALLEHETRAA
jgi:excisionase family DNA binding protein